MNSENRQLGRYDLLEEIAGGSSGTVWRARDRELDRIVAVKILKDDAGVDRAQIERFHREARLAARLDHPNIVRIFDAGNEGASRYIAMALVEGKPLYAAAAERRFTPREAALLIEKISRAVHFAHTQGIIHRDLKPSNIILDRNGEPVITDFGIARSMAAETTRVTRTGELLGTPAYMAPEQMAGDIRNVDARADLYALGVIFYELLTERLPFMADSLIELSRKVLNDDPPAPSTHAPALHADLETICLKAMNRRKEDRFATAEAMADDLRRFNQGETILAKRTSRVARLVRRRRTLIPAAVLLVAALAIFLALRPEPTAGRAVRLAVDALPEGTRVVVAQEQGGTRDLGVTPLAPADLRIEGGFAIRLSKEGCVDAVAPVASDREGEIALRLTLPKADEGNRDMVLVPGGEFLSGDPAIAPRRVTLKSFLIDRHEVTCEAYYAYVQATGRPAPPNWKNGRPTKESLREPVTSITCEEAEAYARWRGKRLPTEEEWEKAARGVDARIFPWGNQPDHERANCAENPMRQVFTVGRTREESPYGCRDMAGNVREWTSSAPEWDAEMRIVKGGCYKDTLSHCTAYYQEVRQYNKRDYTIGFRCARDVEPNR